jgi:hypothetical protein
MELNVYTMELHFKTNLYLSISISIPNNKENKVSLVWSVWFVRSCVLVRQFCLSFGWV